MNRVFNKSVKMLILTLMSIVVVSVSAITYYSVVMEPTVSISQAVISFVQGDDWTTGSSMGTNNTYVSLDISAYPNATLTYEELVNISNTDASVHNVRLSHVSIIPNGIPSVANFTFINFTLIQPDGNPVAGSDFDYTTSGNSWNTPSAMGYQNLAASTQWVVKIETRAAAGASDGISCTIVIEVDVQV